MFIRQKRNKSGSTSVQIISKEGGKYKVIKSLGHSSSQEGITKLLQSANESISEMLNTQSIFSYINDELLENMITELSNSSIRTVGPELVFGRIYDSIGFGILEEYLFRHLVIARLAYPLSKLKTIEYLYRYQGISIEIDKVYRFLDKLSGSLKSRIEQIAYAHSKKILGGNINVVFYDMTTLYFESSDEDDLRRTGFSKDGKHSNPQIYLGLLVGTGGYAIGYDIFEGNIYEGHTLIPFLDSIRKKFDLSNPIVVADAGLLSQNNIQELKKRNYKYIIGSRLKNESDPIKQQIMSLELKDGLSRCIIRPNADRLIITYSTKRATKDAHNRKRGLQRLEKQIRAGKLTKSNINNRGYNKYLRMDGEIMIEIDYDKYEEDKVWDGLKGYVTNSNLSDTEVIENYKNLWYIERAFRMSKTDLRIRPIFHRIRNRIEAHICIAFTAYCIYKELDRMLKKEKSKLSLKKASDITHNIYELTYRLPNANITKSQLLKMDEEQIELYGIIQKYF
jgi:transposase